MDQPKGWTWQDRAEGSIRRGTALDPSTEPVDGIRAFPTAYLPERLLTTRALGDEEAYDREVRTLRDAADTFGWQLEIEDGTRAAANDELVPGVPGFLRARLQTPDEPVRGEWLPSDIVTRKIDIDGVPVGLTDDADPERYPDLYGPLDGGIDSVAGHGTFIAGIIRQAAPPRRRAD